LQWCSLILNTLSTTGASIPGNTGIVLSNVWVKSISFNVHSSSNNYIYYN
jgi:hypothetical protein